MMMMVMRKVKRNIFSAKFAFGERSLNRSPIALLQIEIIVASALSTCKRDEDLGNFFGGFVLCWNK